MYIDIYIWYLYDFMTECVQKISHDQTKCKDYLFKTKNVFNLTTKFHYILRLPCRLIFAVLQKHVSVIGREFICLTSLFCYDYIEWNENIWNIKYSCVKY